MDPLFHFLISFSGGYVILRETDKKAGIKEALALSFISILIDLDHIPHYILVLLGANQTKLEQVLGVKPLIFHNLLTVALIILISAFLLKGKLKLCGYTLSVMIFGHLLFDMVEGLGVELLFPFSGNLYVIPASLNLMVTQKSYLISVFGIALALYFTAVFLAVLALRKYKK